MAVTRPLIPDDSKPHNIVFVNYMRLIRDGEMNTTQANTQLDDLGINPNFRFWGSNTVLDPKSGRFSTFYYKWVNGGWADGTGQIQQEARSYIGGKK